jgi:hypothetical protein
MARYAGLKQAIDRAVEDFQSHLQRLPDQRLPDPQTEAGDPVEVPDGLGEQAVGGSVIALSGLSSGLPDAADGVPSEADDPGGDHASEEVEDLLSEDDSAGC